MKFGRVLPIISSLTDTELLSSETIRVDRNDDAKYREPSDSNHPILSRSEMRQLLRDGIFGLEGVLFA